jgi:hypothetical protein
VSLRETQREVVPAAPADGRELSLHATTAVAYDQQQEGDLTRLYLRLESEIIDAMRWYIVDKNKQSRWSRALRAVALLLAGAGAIAPLLTIATAGRLPGEWGYLALGGAAVTVSFDRFFGYSTAWSRDILASFALQRVLAELQFDWLEVAQGDLQDADHVRTALRVLRGHSLSLRTIIELETSGWATEFHGNLASLDQSIVRAGQVAIPLLPSTSLNERRPPTPSA